MFRESKVKGFESTNRTTWWYSNGILKMFVYLFVFATTAPQNNSP